MTLQLVLPKVQSSKCLSHGRVQVDDEDDDNKQSKDDNSDNCQPGVIGLIFLESETTLCCCSSIRIPDLKQGFVIYVNLPMQYTEIFLVVKMKILSHNFLYFFIFAQNTDCGYTLESPRRGGSNEYPQSMSWSKNKKNRYIVCIPLHIPVLLYERGV